MVDACFMCVTTSVYMCVSCVLLHVYTCVFHVCFMCVITCVFHVCCLHLIFFFVTATTHATSNDTNLAVKNILGGVVGGGVFGTVVIATIIIIIIKKRAGREMNINTPGSGHDDTNMMGTSAITPVSGFTHTCICTMDVSVALNSFQATAPQELFCSHL